MRNVEISHCFYKLSWTLTNPYLMTEQEKESFHKQELTMSYQNVSGLVL